MKRGANAPYLAGALVADGIELGAAVAVGVRRNRAGRTVPGAARRALLRRPRHDGRVAVYGELLWRFFGSGAYLGQRSWVCLLCAFFSSRTRFDDKPCSDILGSKL